MNITQFRYPLLKNDNPWCYVSDEFCGYVETPLHLILWGSVLMKNGYKI